MAASGHKYLGPSDIFTVGDKDYKQGESIPLSKELKEHHERFGHRFEDTPEDLPIVPRVMSEPVLGAHPSDVPIVPKTP